MKTWQFTLAVNRPEMRAEEDEYFTEEIAPDYTTAEMQARRSAEEEGWEVSQVVNARQISPTYRR